LELLQFSIYDVTTGTPVKLFSITAPLERLVR
jgi:hypothetical protein